MIAKKYFLYTRISNDDYDKSIDNQKDVLYKIADSKSIDKKDIVPYEEHKSGSINSERQYFDDMLDKLEKDIKAYKKFPEEREYGWILFFKIDRLARNDKDFERLLRILDAGYQFISATETIENTPTGRLLFRLLAGFAVYESEKLGSRVIISRIHSLVKQEFDSMGGDLAIFGYKHIKDKKKIVLDETKKNIVIKIYDQYLSDEKQEYKDIFNKIDKEFSSCLTKYLTKWTETAEWKIKKIKITPSNLIRNIIVNDTAMKYNWFIEININVKDELIKYYLEAIKEKHVDNNMYTLEGNIKIGGKIKFIYFDPNLMLVPDRLYYEVVNKNNKNKHSANKIDEKWLFTDILFLDHRWRQVSFSWKIDKKKWKYINYRVKVWSESFTISEKKIEDKLFSTTYIKKIISSVDACIDDIKNWILANENDSDVFKMRRKRIVAVINLYRDMKEYYQSQLEINDNDIELHLKSMKKYQLLEDEYVQKERNIEDDLYGSIEKYLEIIKIKDIRKEDYFTRRLFCQTLFQKIIYCPTSADDFKLIIEPFTFISEIAWLSETITI